MTNIKKLNEKLEQFLEADDLTSKLEEIFTKNVSSKIDPKYELDTIRFFCTRANERFVGIYRLNDGTASVLLYIDIIDDGSLYIRINGYKDGDYNEKDYFVPLRPRRVMVTQDEALDKIPQVITDSFDQVLNQRYNDAIEAVSNEYHIPKEDLEIAQNQKGYAYVYVHDIEDDTLFQVNNKSGKVYIV